MNNFGTPFDPNSFNEKEEEGAWPVYENAYDAESYARVFAQVVPTLMQQWSETAVAEIQDTQKNGGAVDVLGGKAIRKAPGLPPGMQSFARFSLLPETYNGGVIQWPGFPPEAIRKVVRENIAPQTIINMRVDDVLNYSTRSTHPWKPGWRVKLRDGFEVPDAQLKKDIEEAQHFLENCTVETIPARERDAKQLTDFATFLGQLVRDSLTFDGMAVWTDMDLAGRVKSFKTLSSYNIRLCLPQGYMGDETVYAVGVDEAGNVIHTFTRDQLIFRHRNARADADIAGYGYPEIEQTIQLIQGFQNALEMNYSVFTRSSTPNGFLVVKGGMNQKQLDILSRIWINLKRGITKSWALPVIPAPKDGDIEIRDLSPLKEMDVYYSDFMNMIAGLFCAMYRFPVRRLGYHISGRAKDNTPPETPTTTAPGIEDYDPYIGVLLRHVETLLNHYIVWTRWPHLQHEFTSKSPKEDAREYEAQVLASTVDERRALNDQPELETLGKDEDEKMLLKLLGKAPVDPALGGIYQSLITAIFAPKPGEDGAPGSSFTSKKDPARAQDHGHMSGVRRDSAAESAK